MGQKGDHGFKKVILYDKVSTVAGCRRACFVRESREFQLEGAD